MRSFHPRITPEALLNSLLGLGCTVLVPTFTYDLEQPAPPDAPANNGWDYDAWQVQAHDKRWEPALNQLSLADMGALPAAVLARPGRVRGDHPLNSFAAIGPHAEIAAAQSARSVYAPLESVVTMGGKVILVGTSLTSTTMIHLAESRAGRTLFLRWAHNSDGTRVACDTGSCSVAFDNFLDVVSMEADIMVGGSRWRILDAQHLLAEATEAILRDRAITSCGRAGCLRCRDALAGGPGSR